MEKIKTIKSYGNEMLKNAESTDDQKFGSFYLSRFLGFNISFEGECCLVKFIATPPMFNPQGSLHGGIIATAMDVAIGKKVDVVAVFDVSSVRKTMKVVIIRMISQGLSSTNKLNDVPSH